jgi:hypothetical protein
MSQLSIKHPVRVVLGAAAALLLFTSAGDAQRGGPFAHLPGTWGGPGMITLNTGVKEKIRCRSVYKVAETGTDLQLELRCAGDAYKFELKGAVSHASDGAISGTWSEVTRGAVGTISGTSKGNQINLRASSPIFSAMLAVVTQSNQQSISIQSPGSEISAVAINLTRGAK